MSKQTTLTIPGTGQRIRSATKQQYVVVTEHEAGEAFIAGRHTAPDAQAHAVKLHTDWPGSRVFIFRQDTGELVHSYEPKPQAREEEPAPAPVEAETPASEPGEALTKVRLGRGVLAFLAATTRETPADLTLRSKAADARRYKDGSAVILLTGEETAALRDTAHRMEDPEREGFRGADAVAARAIIRWLDGITRK